MRAEIAELAEDFTAVANLADIPLSVEDVSVESLFAPHSPRTVDAYNQEAPIRMTTKKSQVLQRVRCLR